MVGEARQGADVVEVAVRQDDGGGPRVRAEALGRGVHDAALGQRHSGVDQHPLPVAACGGPTK